MQHFSLKRQNAASTRVIQLVAVISYLDLDNRQIVSQANKLRASGLYSSIEVQAAPHQDTAGMGRRGGG